jgi:hypothetical protein
MPPNTVYVGRPTKWGNPFKGKDRDEIIRQYRLWITRGALDPYELRGKNLACWCPLDKPCHADILLELANELTTKEQT